MIIKLSINLSKIDKSKIVEKNGKKFLNLLLKDSRHKSDYGDDGYLQHDQSKEEREGKAEAIFVGNWRYLFKDAPKSKPAEKSQREFGESGTAGKAFADGEDESVPF